MERALEKEEEEEIHNQKAKPAPGRASVAACICVRFGASPVCAFVCMCVCVCGKVSIVGENCCIRSSPCHTVRLSFSRNRRQNSETVRSRVGSGEEGFLQNYIRCIHFFYICDDPHCLCAYFWLRACLCVCDMRFLFTGAKSLLFLFLSHHRHTARRADTK